MCYNYIRQDINKEEMCMLKKLFVVATLFGLAGAYIRKCNKKTYCTVGAESNENS